MTTTAPPPPTTTTTTDETSRRRRGSQGRAGGRTPPNILGALGGWLWLAVIIVPIYYIVITSLRSQEGFFNGNPLAFPTNPTLDNYKLVLNNGFFKFFFNSVIVTTATVVVTLVVSPMAAYVIVRGSTGIHRRSYSLFLLGLAIPLQATIIPIYYMMTKAHLYDTLIALILPSIAFSIPLSVIILSNFLRDVPKELFEAMHLEGATEWQMMWKLAYPMIKP